MSTVTLKGSSGEAQVTVASAAGTPTITLPTASINLATDGSDGQYLKTNGSGTLSFATPSSNIVQVKQTRKKDTVTNSVAHSTWETLELAGSITPSAATNTIRIQMVANVGQSSTHFSGYSVYREINGGAAAQLTGYLGNADGNRTRTAQSSHHNPANQDNQVILDYLDDISSWTSGAITYTLYGFHGEHGGAVTMYLNRGNYDNDHQQVSRPMSTVTLTEIAAGGWSVA